MNGRYDPTNENHVRMIETEIQKFNTIKTQLFRLDGLSSAAVGAESLLWLVGAIGSATSILLKIGIGFY